MCGEEMVTVQLYSRLYTRCTVHSLSSRTDLMSMLRSKNWRHLPQTPRVHCSSPRYLEQLHVMFRIWICIFCTRCMTSRGVALVAAPLLGPSGSEFVIICADMRTVDPGLRSGEMSRKLEQRTNSPRVVGGPGNRDSRGTARG